MEERRAKRTYTEEFKRQMVALHNSGKTQAELIREYELTPSALRRWVARINATGSSREKDNLTPAEEELTRLRKRNRQLEMENDILKQAALILGKK